jgi:hypothetical protein
VLPVLVGHGRLLLGVYVAAPARRGKGKPSQSKDKTPEQRHQGMTWVQRLKCGGESKVIASIEDQTETWGVEWNEVG